MYTNRTNLNVLSSQRVTGTPTFDKILINYLQLCRLLNTINQLLNTINGLLYHELRSYNNPSVKFCILIICFFVITCGTKSYIINTMAKIL